MRFCNTYAELPERFFERIEPTPVRAPRLLLFNEALAEQLGIDPELARQPQRLAQLFGGNETLPGSEPLALAYAGHQFGNFVPQLGDGRAHLLGELVDVDGEHRDIQLKGSGRTAFSRGGDGRCALGPALREYIMSEAMHALRIPTMRSLAVVATGEPVMRETPQPGAVVTRVARSHLRVGTFQYFAVRKDEAALRELADYAIERLYPEVAEAEDRYMMVLDRVAQAQIALVVDWMRVGFIHGVMNTDNTAISGETIDYGPCAMMSAYDPGTVFSSIDRMGRYAFGNQPAIIAWNLARLAETFLPLIDEAPPRALERAQSWITTVPERLDDAWQDMMARKLGLPDAESDADRRLISDITQHMHQERLDYTNTFDALTRSLEGEPQAQPLAQEQHEAWQQRLEQRGIPRPDAAATMRRANPVVIPRNHHVESILAHTQQTLDTARAREFLEVLGSPYEVLEHTAKYQDEPADGDRDYVTFCGT